MNREQMIADLVANCEAWKGDDGKEVLEGMTEDRLKRVHAAAVREAEGAQALAVVNEVRDGFGLSEDVPLESLAAQAVKAARRKQMVANAGGTGCAGEPDDDEGDMGGMPMKMKKKKKMTANEGQADKPRRLSDILADPSVDPRDRQVWNTAQKYHQREVERRVKEIEAIIANTKDAGKKEMLEELLDSNPTLEELERAALLAKEPEQTTNRAQEPDDRRPAFFGANVGAVRQVRNDRPELETMDLDGVYNELGFSVDGSKPAPKKEPVGAGK